VGIAFAGILLSMMLIGGELAQSRLGLPNALSSVLQGLLLLMLLVCDTLILNRVRWRARSPA
jgi:simple sugar transport system permease protein